MMTKKELNEKFKELTNLYHSPIEYNPKDPYWFIQSEEVILFAIGTDWEFSTKELLGILSSNIFTLGVDTVAMGVERILKNHGKEIKEDNPLLLDLLKKFVESLKTNLVNFAVLKENEYYSIKIYNDEYRFGSYEDLAKYISQEKLRGNNFTVSKVEKGDIYDHFKGVLTINTLGCINNINGSAKLNNRLWEELECSDIYIPNQFSEDELVVDISSNIVGLVCTDYENDEDLDPGSVLVKVYDKSNNELVYHRFPIISTDYYELSDESRLDILKCLNNYKLKELISDTDK